jgi:hypothetical protein
MWQRVQGDDSLMVVVESSTERPQGTRPAPETGRGSRVKERKRRRKMGRRRRKEEGIGIRIRD